MKKFCGLASPLKGTLFSKSSACINYTTWGIHDLCIKGPRLNFVCSDPAEQLSNSNNSENSKQHLKIFQGSYESVVHMSSIHGINQRPKISCYCTSTYESPMHTLWVPWLQTTMKIFSCLLCWTWPSSTWYAQQLNSVRENISIPEHFSEESHCSCPSSEHRSSSSWSRLSFF